MEAFTTSLVSVINPLSLSLHVWLTFLGIKTVGIQLWDKIIEFVITLRGIPPTLAYREREGNKKFKGLEKLEKIDYTFLSVNNVIEYIFVLNMYAFATSSETVKWSFADITPLNTLVCFYSLFFFNDFLYAPMHWFLHWKPVYKYVHKHHHRQTIPYRGYTDAANEHPIENMMGTALFYWSDVAVAHLCGMHVVTMFLHFLVYSGLALLNHTKHDITLNLGLFKYSVGNHEMHHRYGNVNMGQYWMGWDHLFNTFRAYK